MRILWALLVFVGLMTLCLWILGLGIVLDEEEHEDDSE